METKPVICFGQQPNGFFPKRFLIAKINTARKLQAEIGGRIAYFYHDSDADYRETITIMRDRFTSMEVRLNFLQPNKIQKKYSPLYAKGITENSKQEIIKQLPRFVGKPLIDLFVANNKSLVADFCLEMYQKMGLLNNIEVARSGTRDFREKAIELETDYFADVEYQDEIVRAQLMDNQLVLHEGGGKYLTLPQPAMLEKWQKSPGRDQRFAWMQSVLHCTHYIYGEGESEYLQFDKFPSVKFIPRDPIDNGNYAWIQTDN